MTRPSEVPEVEGTNATGSGAPLTQASDGTEYVTVPEQIWVRSATHDRAGYTLTLATAPSGRFSLYDAHAVGGIDAAESSSIACKITARTPLTRPISGAIKAVTTLTTLHCSSKVALKLPVVRGEWGDTTKGGQTEAVFALGGTEAQGRPAAPGSTTPNGDAPSFDTRVISVTHHGSRLHVQAWATDYLSLSVMKSDPGDSADDPQCSTTVTPQHRPGIKSPAQQRLFDITCANLPSTEGYSVMAMTTVTALGEEPDRSTFAVDLKAGATAP